jgi:hypothetical protein
MRKEPIHTPEFDRIMSSAPNAITRYGHWLLIALLVLLGLAVLLFHDFLF